MPWIEPITLEGDTIRLVPAEPHHADDLHAVCLPDTFQYYVSLQPADASVQAFREYFAKRLQHPKTQNFVVIEKATGKPIGETSYMDIREDARGLEIGMTWYAAEARGTRVNPECKFLLLQHAFETLKAIRVTLKTDARNLHSQAAIRKLRAQYEGTLRRHGIQPNGFVRDTVYFGITDLDWPDVKANLELRLT